MTSHVKMYTNGYLFERLKIICLSYAFKINRMQFKWLRLLIQKNIPPCEWLLQSIRKYSSVRTAEVFNSEKYSIGKGCPWIWQREFDQILATITLFFTEPLLAYTPKVLLCRCQEVCHFFQLCQVISNLGTIRPQNTHLGVCSQSFPSSTVF